jgi:SAM-dependent methyltransferase
MIRKTYNSEWWSKIFNEDYIKTYIDITTPKKTKKQVDFLIKKLTLTKNQYILDLACGQGRHSLELARRGFKNVTGFDFSKQLLAIAQKQNAKEKLTVRFIKGDIRNLPFKGSFDVILNLFTSFGYFAKESDHSLVLQQVAQSLKENGLFFLDIKNPVHAQKQLDKSGQYLSKIVSNGFFIHSKNKVKGKRWVQRLQWTENNKQKLLESSVRMFSCSEIKSLLNKANLIPQKIWGSYRGELFKENSSPRLLILSKKEPQKH